MFTWSYHHGERFIMEKALKKLGDAARSMLVTMDNRKSVDNSDRGIGNYIIKNEYG